MYFQQWDVPEIFGSARTVGRRSRAWCVTNLKSANENSLLDLLGCPRQSGVTHKLDQG
jgi:hypothetical protein